jgi:glycosyltransferase involved in cell wall biosynthesis
MNVLFVHNNFPAQFRHLAAALVKDPTNSVAAIGSHTAASLPGVRLIKYALPQADVSETHPFARRFDLECRRAEQVLYGLSGLTLSGFKPDLIFAHPGWGETLPLRNMFPDARIALYCEYYYSAHGGDMGFDAEFPVTGLDGHVALQIKNATTLLALEECNLGISPTRWQHSTFPAHYQSKIQVAHEGIKVDIAKPNAKAVLRLSDGELTSSDEVVTFIARNLEPVRGYHILMRVVPQILKRRPNAHIVIVGGEGTSYGAAPPAGTTWKSVFLKEMEARIDLRRVHFLGQVPYETYLRVLQISSAHVYLTYPFVLSWSMLEAMSTGCVGIGSDTAPVREVIIDGETGILVPFFDIEQWADRIVEVLSAPKRFISMRRAARAFIQNNFDVDKICVPRLLSLLQTDHAKNGHPQAGPQQASPQQARQQTSRQQTSPHQTSPQQASPQQASSQQANSQPANGPQIKPDETNPDQTNLQRSDHDGSGQPRSKRVWPGKSGKTFKKTAAPSR